MHTPIERSARTDHGIYERARVDRADQRADDDSHHRLGIVPIEFVVGRHGRPGVNQARHAVAKHGRCRLTFGLRH